MSCEVADGSQRHVHKQYRFPSCFCSRGYPLAQLLGCLAEFKDDQNIVRHNGLQLFLDSDPCKSRHWGYELGFTIAGSALMVGVNVGWITVMVGISKIINGRLL
jgi:hypothetical protein